MNPARWWLAVVTGGLPMVTSPAAVADPPDFARPLCPRPAVTGLKVVNDRWPDASSPGQFALDAIRLENARTDQDKAIAVWLWTRRFTTYTDGHPPTERIAARRGYVYDPIKIYNVWGAHWCDGLSRCVELCWRHLGYRAQKFYKAGHTLCDAWWVDPDGVGRYHVFDVSEGWFAYDRTGRRLAGAEDLVRDVSLVHRPAGGPHLRRQSTHSMYGWVHATHLPWDSGHRTELTLRAGETMLRLWGNLGKPFQDNVIKTGDKVPAEHGPYPVTYGNGVWTFTADLSEAGLRRDCFQQPVNCRFVPTPKAIELGYLTPADPNRPAVLVYRILTPYIISSLAAKPTGEPVKVELSDDGGKRWREFSGGEGEVELGPPTKDVSEISAFGRYDVLVRLTLAKGRLRGLKLATTVQHNLFALPQLHPGDNRITIHGQLAKGQAVRVAYVWNDPAGRDRQNVTVAAELPHTYTIRAAGSKWKDVVCKSLLVEAAPADGRGSRTEVKEADLPLREVAPLPSYQVTLGTKAVEPLKGVADYIDVLRSSTRRKDLHNALAAVRVIGDARAYDAVRHVAMTDLGHPKIQALQTMYWLDRKRAMGDFLRILDERCPDIRYKHDEKNPAVRAGHYYAVVAQIARFLADEQVRESVPALVRLVQVDAKKGMWNEPRRGIIRSLGELADKSAVPTLMKFVSSRGVDDAEVAVEALGRLGDPQAAGVIRRVARQTDYTPLRRECIRALGRLEDRGSVVLFRRFLTDPDEDARGAAAEALARVGDAASLAALKRQLAVEPVAWVREVIGRSIEELSAVEKPAKTGRRR